MGGEVTKIDPNIVSPKSADPMGTGPLRAVPSSGASQAGGGEAKGTGFEGAGIEVASAPAANGEDEAEKAENATADEAEAVRDDRAEAESAEDLSESLIGVVKPHRWRLFHTTRGLVSQTYRHGVEIELMHRAFGFAALGFVTLVPLLIVVAAAAPLNGRTFPEWAIGGLGLSGQAATAVNHLFGPTNRVLSTTTALGLAVLAVFGLSFVSVVQTGMARVWELPAARLLSVWRQAVWLAVLVGLLLVGSDLLALLHDGWFITSLRWCATAGGSTLFFWWTPRFLLEGRVPWRGLLPGAIFTVIGLVGLRIFSAYIFSPLIVSSAVTYGTIGAVLIVVSWLIGIGFVIFGAALVGRVLYEVWTGGE